MHTFPNFKVLEPSDIEVIAKLVEKFPSYSDFNPLSMYSWNATGENAYSVLNGNLVLKIKDYLGEGFLYSLLGVNDIDLSLDSLLKSTPKLNFVPEIVVSKIENITSFKIEEDRDNFDYILNIKKVVDLDGHKFRHLRQDVAKFKKLYPIYQFKKMDSEIQPDMHAIFEVSKKWMQNKAFDTEKIKEETLILENFFEYSKKFNCVHLGLFIENKLEGYISSELLANNFAIGHFGSANTDFACITPTITYLTCKYLYESGYTHYNMEQDAGLQGLRTSKLFFNPEYFLKKFTISRY